MSLEQAFRRLTLQPRSICHHCRRTFASSARSKEQQSATAAFTELLQASRNESETQRTSIPHPARQPPSSSPGSPAANPDQYELARQTITESAAARTEAKRTQQLAELNKEYNRKDLESQQHRRYKVGDVYAPHDLSGVEASKWKKLRRKTRVGSHGTDVLDGLGVDPRKEYKNFSMMAEYVSEMGRIKHRSETGLKPANQRRMAKAVRRAIGSGVLMPSVYRHPELIRGELEARGQRGV